MRKLKVFLNKKTGQSSIVLPKRDILKIFSKMPKEVNFDVNDKSIKW